MGGVTLLIITLGIAEFLVESRLMNYLPPSGNTRGHEARRLEFISV